MSFDVRFSDVAADDLVRLHEQLLARAVTVEDLQLADEAVDEIEIACKAQLARTPYLYRKAGDSSTRRELVIPFGAAGYVALFEIAGPTVMVLAVRHQREEDFR
ncbi:MAG: type II toxin-antitoxin system RelE/ParE family toxin [Burkholderiales bacterium]|nr:type II toxin-antitoxin system RelE/ParE family toxin [Burkholderiales bacterium]MDE2396343.1 type II toxin-antitoxin system RelE/ParE family toxin [Burkholderiales bacterium]MDE2456258.1 type II toxin-antitoxin system RelE/ParE family toxin [Burkholderiales bacterium]